MSHRIYRADLLEGYKDSNEGFATDMAELLNADMQLETKLETAAGILQNRQHAARHLYEAKGAQYPKNEKLFLDAMQETQRMTIAVSKTYIPLLEKSVRTAPAGVAQFAWSYEAGGLLLDQEIIKDDSLLKTQLGFIGAEALAYMQTNADNSDVWQTPELWRNYARDLLPYAAPATQEILQARNRTMPTNGTSDQQFQFSLLDLPSKLVWQTSGPAN